MTMKQKVILTALCILSIVQTIAIILLANKQSGFEKKQKEFNGETIVIFEIVLDYLEEQNGINALLLNK